MTSPENALSLTTAPTSALPEPSAEPLTPDQTQDEPSYGFKGDSMDEFYALRRELLFTTLAFTAVAFASVLAYYGSSVALSYLFGAAVGLYYLRMLAKSVEQLTSQKGLGKSRIALVAILVILAARWDQIQILPAFLGFLTYKLALIYYTLRITLLR